MVAIDRVVAHRIEDCTHGPAERLDDAMRRRYGMTDRLDNLPFAPAPPRPESLQTLLEVAEERHLAVGRVIDSAAAKSKSIDRAALDFYTQHYGPPPRDLGFLEADLISTTTGSS